jgi:cardiolipin synthase
MKCLARSLPARCLVVVTALLLAACTSMPIMVPDLAETHETVRVEAPDGRLLSPEQSKALIDRQGGGRQGTVLERHLAVEQAVAGNPLTAGNAVVLLQNGPPTYEAMFAAIRGARDHINMETYILEDDDIGRRFAAALIARQRAGVQVNLIHDGVGTFGTPKEFFKRLTDAGVAVLEFNPVNPLTAKAGWDVNQRDHRKILVVDGETAFLGGINISGVYSGSRIGGSSGRNGGLEGGGSAGDAKARHAELPWRDTDLQVTGPVVADLQKMFIETWKEQKGPPLAQRRYFPKLAAKGPAVVRAIGSAPDDPYSLIYATLLSAINSAESQIWITNAYFVPDPQLSAALIAAARRGVDVKMVLPSTSDSWLVFRAGRAHYDELLRGGVKLYERKDALLHAKTALIDGVWSTVGSTNLDWRSFIHNQEVNVVVLGTDFGDRMRAAFENDLAASSPITVDEWERRPIGDRFKEWFGQMWEYWL